METNQLFSSNSGREMRGFIFNRLQQTDNQKTLYTLRLISKSEQERVEKKIQTAKINFCHIENFATSKFSERIKFLEVCLRESQDCYDSFKYLSDTYLPYAPNIYVKAYIFGFIRLVMREPLTFQRLHIVNYGQFQSTWLIVDGIGKYNVQIRDCKFIGIGVNCRGNPNVYVTGSKFIKGIFGLSIRDCDSVHIDKITLDNFYGLSVDQVKEVVNITNICVISQKCYIGILLGQITANFKLSNTIIKDCDTGISIRDSCCGEIQKTNIEGCTRCGIQLYYGAIVHYAAVEFKNNKQDVEFLGDSQFLPLENI